MNSDATRGHGTAVERRRKHGNPPCANLHRAGTGRQLGVECGEYAPFGTNRLADARDDGDWMRPVAPFAR